LPRAAKLRVKPYVERGKTDPIDAAAICEAVNDGAKLAQVSARRLISCVR
jgi:hypothetical protein